MSYNAYPWNIVAGVLGAALYLAWSLRVRNCNAKHPLKTVADYQCGGGFLQLVLKLLIHSLSTTFAAESSTYMADK
jgi:hypothetical protein